MDLDVRKLSDEALKTFRNEWFVIGLQAFREGFQGALAMSETEWLRAKDEQEARQQKKGDEA